MAVPNLREYDIVLSALRVSGESVRGLIALLSGSRANLFCSSRVERGYGWLPVLKRGKECIGTSALRPGEFIDAFDQLVKGDQPEHADAATVIHSSIFRVEVLPSTFSSAVTVSCESTLRNFYLPLESHRKIQIFVVERKNEWTNA